ncbi:BPSL0761 family protein [Paraburkholderia sediminicola]|uniref:BPSL0761 family protein n=1 Tax=Paraburkholderia sediminicola TaxID=458836 RepID=UPI0038BAAF77
MTLPYERTRAVLGAQELLTQMACAQEDVDLNVLRKRARVLLRHFPERVHLQLSAAMAPEIWGEPCPRAHE